MATLFRRWRRAAEDAGPASPAVAVPPQADGPRSYFFDTLWLDGEAVVRDVELPTFSAMASDDVEGTGAEPALARSRLALRDALGAAQPVISRERFAGRADALTQLIEAIEQRRLHVVVYGERGIGKTSLVHVFADTARAARYIVLYGSCGTDSRFDETIRAFAARIPMLYHRSVLPTTAAVEQTRSFDSMLPAGNFGPREASEVLSDVVGTRVIMILDEYDRVADPAFRRDVAELIKNLSDRAARVQLILTGVAANLDELIGFAPSIRRNIVGLPLRPLATGEVAEILRLGEASANVVFTDPAITIIAALANGSPYLVRLIGHGAGLLALDARSTRVDAVHARRAVDQILADWTASLPRRVQALLTGDDARERWPLLVAAAAAGAYTDGWFIAADVAAEATGSVARGSIEGALQRLAEPDNLLESDELGSRQRFRFSSPGVAAMLLMSDALARLDG